MSEYYNITVFLLEKKDLWKEKSDILDPTNSGIINIKNENVYTLIAKKVRGGFKEIKTDRFIPDENIIKHTSVRERLGGVLYLYDLAKKIKMQGAILVTSSKYEDTLVSEVKNVEEVKEYLEKDIALEMFEKLDKLTAEGVVLYKEEQKSLRQTKIDGLKQDLLALKEKIRLNQAERSNKRALGAEIDEIVKTGIKGRK